MIPASELPKMFYLDPGLDTSRLRIGTVFVCCFCPEATTGDDWVIIRFRVVMAESIHPSEKGKFFRGVQQLSKEAVTEEKALKLYESAWIKERTEGSGNGRIIRE